MQKQSVWTPEFIGMSLSSFFQYMTHYGLIAALPVYVIEGLQGNDWQAGLAMTFFQIGAVLFRPLAGRWVDQCDKKKMLFLSLSIFLVISILYIGIHSLYFLYAVRLLHGAIFAIGTTAAATVAALVLPAQRKGEGIGYFAMFANLAMVIGPFFSLTLIAHFPFMILFSGFVILAVLAFWFGTRNHLAEAVRQPAANGDSHWQWDQLFEPCALPMALIGGFLFLAYAGVLVFIPIYTKHLQLTAYTSLFFAVFALTIVVTRPLVGKAFDRSGANRVVYPGFAFFIAGLISLSQVQSVSGFLVSAVIIGIGFGALSPVFQTLAIQFSPAQKAGVATATYFLALDISIGLGSFLLSVIAAHSGYRAMYMVAAVIVAVTAVIYYGVWTKNYAAKELNESV